MLAQSRYYNEMKAGLVVPNRAITRRRGLFDGAGQLSRLAMVPTDLNWATTA